jgi:hypothetical protein
MIIKVSEARSVVMNKFGVVIKSVPITNMGVGVKRKAEVCVFAFYLTLQEIIQSNNGSQRPFKLDIEVLEIRLQDIVSRFPNASSIKINSMDDIRSCTNSLVETCRNSKLIDLEIYRHAVDVPALEHVSNVVEYLPNIISLLIATNNTDASSCKFIERIANKKGLKRLAFETGDVVIDRIKAIMIKKECTLEKLNIRAWRYITRCIGSESIEKYPLQIHFDKDVSCSLSAIGYVSIFANCNLSNLQLSGYVAVKIFSNMKVTLDTCKMEHRSSYPYQSINTSCDIKVNKFHVILRSNEIKKNHIKNLICDSLRDVKIFFFISETYVSARYILPNFFAKWRRYMGTVIHGTNLHNGLCYCASGFFD